MLKSWWTAAGAAAVLAGVLVVLAPGPPDTAAEDEAMVLAGGQGSSHRGGPINFSLEGKPVRGLYPGAVRQMRITVFNPFGARLQLRQVSGMATSSSRRDCPANSTSLQIQTYTGRLPVTIPAHGRTTLEGTLPISMPSGTSEKCAGSRFAIAITATAYRVDR